MQVLCFTLLPSPEITEISELTKFTQFGTKILFLEKEKKKRRKKTKLIRQGNARTFPRNKIVQGNTFFKFSPLMPGISFRNITKCI